MKNFLLVLFAVCLAIPASAYDFCDEASGLYFNFIYDEETEELTSNVELTKGDSDYAGAVVIPETATYKRVAFTVVGIGEKVFEGSSVTSVEMPNTITYIGDDAFHRCYSLTSVNISTGLETLGREAFYSCTSLAGSVTIPDAVTVINDYTFASTKLTSITIGNYVTSIGVSAFYSNHNLREFIIPATVTYINNTAFMDCWVLTTITSLNPYPPTSGNNIFDGVNEGNYSEVTLYVPAGSSSNYASSSQWAVFNIVELDGGGDTDGIGALNTEGAEITGYYTTDGKQADGLQQGVNVVRYSDGTAKKVLVK